MIDPCDHVVGDRVIRVILVQNDDDDSEELRGSPLYNHPHSS